MVENKKKIKDVIGAWFIKASIVLNTVMNIGASKPAEPFPEKNDPKDETKDYVIENNNNMFLGVVNLDDAPVDMLDIDVLAQNLVDQRITLSDVIASGAISKEELTEFHYTQEDLKQMNGSQLMNELQTKLEKKAKRGSQGLCTKYVREAWRDVTNKNKEKYCLGIYSEEQVLYEDLWCTTSRGFAKDWISAVKENSSSLIYLGDFKNTEFDLQESPGFICVVPGVGNEPGHTFFCKDGVQYSDFVNETDWILDNMNGRKYQNEIHLFVSADTPAPYMLVKAMLEKEAEQIKTAKDLCCKYGVDHKDLLAEKMPFGYFEFRDPYERIVAVRERMHNMNNMENVDKEEKNFVAQVDTKFQRNSVAIAVSQQINDNSKG